MTVTVPPRQNPFLFGHEATLKRLLDTHKQGRLHHSLIFVGPQGVGKETLAYHFMRAILQDDAKVFAGSHPHIFVMQPIYDEKKGRFKRDITKGALEGLTEFLRLVPQDDKPRFILINPADGMNNDTQNALLKVLEEPPAQTFFILLATHVASILPTIRSRCLIVSVEPMGAKDFEKSLQHYMPQADFDKVASYQQVAQGVLGTVLRYEQEENAGPSMTASARPALSGARKKTPIPAMQLAEELAPQDSEETAQALDRIVPAASGRLHQSSQYVSHRPLRRSRHPKASYLPIGKPFQSAEATAGIRPPEPCLAGRDRPLS
jgi:hypothetical protein